MKFSLVLALLLLCVLLPLGESIRCYACQDYTGSCSKTKECSQVDACYTLKARGGDTYRDCSKFSECNFNDLSIKYPNIASFTFSCCNKDLCNSAPAASASVLIGVVCSLLAVWWATP